MSEPPLSLVVMAAGLGSRFGGPKQLTPIGPGGETFLDFSIIDATAVGVQRVVVIVRSEIEAATRDLVAGRHPDVDVAYVRQDRHGPPRDKPWGTGHAALCAAEQVPGPFLICNADDYYGPATYAAVAPEAAALPEDRALLAGFEMAQTLPRKGKVSRGVCRVAHGELTSLVETHGIERRDDGTIRADDPPGELADDTVSSMNFWAFPHRMLGELAAGFDRFLHDHRHDQRAEFLLPSMVHELMARGELHVGVVPTHEKWVGVTNPEDLDIARADIAALRG
ncbi:MAG: NTP transferase domain-containing protein [Acidimicrobiales bacterium]